MDRTSISEYRLLAQLFLLELDEPTRAKLSHDERFEESLPQDLAQARIEFTRLFTMSVYPYASVFLDSQPSLNSESSALVGRFYESIDFAPAQGWLCGAPDALGVELACAAHLLERSLDGSDFVRDMLLPWAPVCCLAVERNAHLGFYRTVAQVTRESLFRAADRLTGLNWELQPSEEVEPDVWELHDVIEYLTAAARCGVYISKEDLHRVALAERVPLSFGDRGLMLMSLLRGAGLSDNLSGVLVRLEELVAEWLEAYAGWMRDHASSRSLWQAWHDRASTAQRILVKMSGVSAGWELEPGA